MRILDRVLRSLSNIVPYVSEPEGPGPSVHGCPGKVGPIVNPMLRALEGRARLSNDDGSSPAGTAGQEWAYLRPGPMHPAG